MSGDFGVFGLFGCNGHFRPSGPSPSSEVAGSTGGWLRFNGGTALGLGAPFALDFPLKNLPDPLPD